MANRRQSKIGFYVGRSMDGNVVIVDTFNRVPLPDTDVMKAAKQDKNISAFLSFSPVYKWEIDTYKDHYEVRFIDLRYRSKGHYPFVAIAHIDRDTLELITSYTGWIFSEEKLQKIKAWLCLRAKLFLCCTRFR